MKIGNKEFKVTVPDDPRKGLLGTNSISKDRLMKFSFPDGKAHITMKGMKYPIDLIAVDKGKVSQVIKARVGEDYMFKAKEVYEAKKDSGIEIGQVVKAQKGIGPLLSHRNTKPLSNLVTDLEAMRLLKNYDNKKDNILSEVEIVATKLPGIDRRLSRTYTGEYPYSSNKAAKLIEGFYNESVMPTHKFESDTILPLIVQDNRNEATWAAKRWLDGYTPSHRDKNEVRKAIERDKAKGIALIDKWESDEEQPIYKKILDRVTSDHKANSNRLYGKSQSSLPIVDVKDYKEGMGFKYKEENRKGNTLGMYVPEDNTVVIYNNALKRSGTSTPSIMGHEIGHSEHSNFLYKDLTPMIRENATDKRDYVVSDNENTSRILGALADLEDRGLYKKGAHIDEPLMKKIYDEASENLFFKSSFPDFKTFKSYFNTKFGPRSTSDYKQGGLLKAQNGSVLAKLHFKAKYGKESIDTVKSHSKGGLLVLDDKANVQHEISDGSRIFSRVHTKQLLSLRDKIASMKAGGPIKESHKELAELFFKLIAHQDKLEPEYV